MLEIILIELEVLCPLKLFSHIVQLLPEKANNYIMRYRFINDSRRSLIGYIQSMISVSQTTGTPHSQINITKNAYGKPIVSDFGCLDFNISHSNKYVIFSLVNNGKIGIDIEHIRKPLQIENFSFLTKTEQELVFADRKISMENFYKIWTLRESYLKYKGYGLSELFDAIEILSIDKQIKYITTPWEDLFFYFLDIDIDYISAACLATPVKKINLKRIAEKKLYETYLMLLDKSNLIYP